MLRSLGEKLLAGVALLALAAAGVLRWMVGREARRADAATERARQAETSLAARSKAEQALAAERQRQEAARRPPNLQQRDDLENTW